MASNKHTPGRVRTCSKCCLTGVEGIDFCLGQGNTCKLCAHQRSREYSKEVTEERGERWEKRKATVRRTQAKRRYGVTSEQAERMYAQELCEICKTNPDDRKLSIDHDHSSGRVRGVLCRRCNRGIGFFLDNPDLLREAARYLERE